MEVGLETAPVEDIEVEETAFVTNVVGTGLEDTGAVETGFPPGVYTGLFPGNLESGPFNPIGSSYTAGVSGLKSDF